MRVKLFVNRRLLFPVGLGKEPGKRLQPWMYRGYADRKGDVLSQAGLPHGIFIRLPSVNPGLHLIYNVNSSR